ncbi:MAG: PmoA family protein [Bacteroidota bacterium]|nr:PmoA family protein [Bacteroidota bacterium]
MKNLYFLSLLFFGSVIVNGQNCLCIKVEDDISSDFERPVSIVLDNQKNYCWDKDIVLVKKNGIETEVVPFQIDHNQKNKIWFKHTNEPGVKTTYCFTYKKNLKNVPLFNYILDNGDLKLKFGDQSLIHYRYEMKLPPEGVDKLYQKSGYIHPIISSKGDTLTRIQPPDHYHHYGVWGPWTRTRINDRRVDFWNLKDGQGTVLFKSFKNIIAGSIYGGFVAHQEHFNFTSKKGTKLALNENLTVKVWKNNNPNQYFIDYTTKFSSPLERGILFEAYRYGGGLGFRFKEQWDKENCEVITSEGKNRASADGTLAKWCIVYGDATVGEGITGVLFMSHPKNRSHPEPMRIWPKNANKGRGDMFFEFCPIRHKDWKIEPQKSYELNYRMLVFDGKITPQEAEQHWKAFAFQPLLEISK